MTKPEFDNVAGYLCRISEQEDMRAFIAAKAGVEDWQTIVPNAWFSFVWKTEAGPQKFLLRNGNDRFMLLTDDHTHVNSFFNVCGIENRIERPRIAIASFVKELVSPVNEVVVERPGRAYRVSSIFASVDGYGRSLKTVGLWGDDLLNAALFTNLLQHVNPYRVTVREILRDSDIVSAAAAGEVNFLYRGPSHLRKVDTFFRYLKQRGFIHWALASGSMSGHDDGSC